MTHDYKRNGTTTLFAALNMLDGTVIGECMPRHRHREFLRFLNSIDERTPPNLDLHLIVDNPRREFHARRQRALRPLSMRMGRQAHEADQRPADPILTG
jgi:hypothetical protein